jgi:hypothetical protein
MAEQADLTTETVESSKGGPACEGGNSTGQGEHREEIFSFYLISLCQINHLSPGGEMRFCRKANLF